MYRRLKHPNRMTPAEIEAARTKHGAFTIRPKDVDAVAYVTNPDVIPIYGVGYIGKALRPDWNHRFRTSAQMVEHIEKWRVGLKRSAKLKADLKAARNKPHEIKVGDIFKASWGYDQTNIDYYEVVELAGAAYVMARPICGTDAGPGYTGGMDGYCRPAPGVFKKDEPAKKYKVNGGNSIKVYSHTYAHKIERGADGEYPRDHWTSYH
jgi:hypothetical protein